MEPKPDTIKISTSHREEIMASHADVFITVQGSSAYSGNEAIKKAKEVTQMVDDLTRFGISAENIHLQGARVETSSGALLKSSTASYRLRVRCETVDQIPGLLDIVASRKNASLDRIDWKYSEDEARERVLSAALAKAKSKAEKIATSLGVKLLGVYEFLENFYDEDMHPVFHAQSMPMRSPAPAPTEPSLGMDIQHGKTIRVNVEIWYRVSAF